MAARSFLLLLLLSISLHSLAQRGRAGHLYNKAIDEWTTYNKQDAVNAMKWAIKKSPHAPEAYSQLGEWYFQMHKFLLATYVFQAATKNCIGGGRRFAHPLARSLLYNCMPDSALQIIDKYDKTGDTADWKQMRAQAMFMRSAMMHMQKTWPEWLGPHINTKYPDLFPTMTMDITILYFTRKLKNMNENLMLARYDTCGDWLGADEMGDDINTVDNESAMFISADGHYMFFSRSDNRSEDGTSDGGNDLYMAYRVANDSPWSIPAKFGATINSQAYEGMPSLSPDNNELYFVSDRPGGYGGYDIWISRTVNGLWDMPVNAGPKINTAGNETAPYISLDNSTLYFTSDGWPGMGGTDIYMARKHTDTTWYQAVNLGYPINTACNEESQMVKPDGENMIFASDRQGPIGNFDLYQVELPYDLRPHKVSYLAGYVYDSISKARLNSAAIYIINADRGDTVYQFRSNRGDGSYVMPLSMDHPIAMHTATIGHDDVRDTFKFDKPYYHEPLVHNVCMLPSDYVKPVNDSNLITINFNVNQVALLDSDIVNIKKAIEPFLQQKGFVLFINGYTDITGTPMINAELSTKRAREVGKIMESVGVDELSMTIRGWGEANMIAPNDDERGQRMNRRVEVVLRR